MKKLLVLLIILSTLNVYSKPDWWAHVKLIFQSSSNQAHNVNQIFTYKNYAWAVGMDLSLIHI